MPFRAGGKTKDLPKRDWYDEHGEDVYIPEKLMLEAYDAEFEMAYCGKELASNPFNLSLALTHIQSFRNWLIDSSDSSSSDDGGCELSVYSPMTAIGRKCYLLSIDDEDPHVQTVQSGSNIYHENVVTFKVKFRVIDPKTNVTPT